MNFQYAQTAARQLCLKSDSDFNKTILYLATLTRQNIPLILSENAKDLALMDKENPKYDRLLLNADRLEAIAKDLDKVAKLPSPLDKILEEKTLENGLFLQKKTVPLGVVGIIYEARPNVTFDVFALCLKAGNVCLLKGSSDAENSNKVIVKLIKQALAETQMPENSVTLLGAERAAAERLLHAVGQVDVIIPRGSQQLIDWVRQNAKVPIIETGAGIVHTYIDESANLELAKSIIFNAKTRRVSVCNALDCLIIHENYLPYLSEIVQPLASQNVEIFADSLAYLTLQKNNSSYPTNLLFMASEQDFGIEFLSYKMSIKTVKNIDQAIEHIALHSSKHSEAIISENQQHIDLFFRAVDSAVVYANTSTAFTDGGQFGMGAEIGISTQKLHARGPMALHEITSYKWLVKGNGQVRK
jgi:glutamate-5-semialdehyde dehydrogenase